MTEEEYETEDSQDEQFEENLEIMRGLLNGEHPSEDVDEGFEVHHAVVAVDSEQKDSTLISASNCEDQILHDIETATELLAGGMLAAGVPGLALADMVNEMFHEACMKEVEAFIEAEDIDEEPEEVLAHLLGGPQVSPFGTGENGSSSEEWDFLQDFDDEAVDIDPEEFR